MKRLPLAPPLLLLIAFLPGQASAATYWGPRADAALTKALATDTGHETPWTNAALAQSIAYRSPNGWADPRVASYLAKVRAARITTGRWGLGYAYDAFQDGTTNPASTSYLITNIGHVGPVLLDAYKAGKATRTEVEDILKVAVAWPKVHNGTDGVCLAYSNSPNDAGADKCVHNVNQATAWFFRQATNAGIVISGMLLLRIQIARYESATYLPASYNWRYIERPGYRLGGSDYQAVGAEWAWFEAPAIGRAAINYSLGRTWPDPMSAIAHVWLAAHDCVGGSNWLSEFDKWLVNPPTGQSPASRLIQAAQAASRAAAACDS